jgi:hypothetical protein
MLLHRKTRSKWPRKSFRTSLRLDLLQFVVKTHEFVYLVNSHFGRHPSSYSSKATRASTCLLLWTVGTANRRTPLCSGCCRCYIFGRIRRCVGRVPNARRAGNCVSAESRRSHRDSSANGLSGCQLAATQNVEKVSRPCDTGVDRLVDRCHFYLYFKSETLLFRTNMKTTQFVAFIDYFSKD